MVAGFQDDVDLEDKTPIKPLLSISPVLGENLTHSSADVAGHPKATILAPQKCPEQETKWSSTKASRPHRGTAPRTAEDSSQGHEDGKEELAASSESDPEGPIAAQMLSFVMDDPDFESDSDTPRRVGEFPVREDLSDMTDEDASPAPQPLASKPHGPPFRVKDDADLFGLGLVETGHKASGSEDKEGRPLSKEKEKKKKKKKKGREEEEKAAKKRSKHKKSKEEEEGREHGRRRPRGQRSSVDALEAFLGGGAPSGHLRGGGDYEEL